MSVFSKLRQKQELLISKVARNSILRVELGIAEAAWNSNPIRYTTNRAVGECAVCLCVCTQAHTAHVLLPVLPVKAPLIEEVMSFSFW